MEAQRFPVLHSVATQALSDRDPLAVAAASFLPVRQEAEPDLALPGRQGAEDACLRALVRHPVHDVLDP